MVKKNQICLFGSSISQFPLVKFLRSKNITFDYISNQSSNLFDQAGGSFIECDLKNIEKIIYLCRSGDYDGILAMGSDVCCRLLSLLSDRKIISDKFVVPVELYDTFFNKSAFQSKLEHSNPIESLSVKINDSWKQTITNFLKTNGKCIVKPVDSYASKGVFMISNSEDFTSIVKKSFEKSASKTLLVQKVIAKDGLQICGDGYIESSEIKFLKLGFNKSYNASFVPLLEAFPSFEIVQTEDIKLELGRIVRNAGIKNSFFNVDIIISGGKIHILELALRLGGNCISDAIFYSSGKNLLDVYIDGEFAPNKQTPLHCINFMLHSKKRCNFYDKMVSHFSDFKEINCSLKNGDVMEPIIDDSKTYGNIIYVFESDRKFSETLEIGTEIGNLTK